MLRIAAYCRVSTDKNDQLNSLKNQKEFFEDYAGKNSCELVKIYADEGISGTSLKNRTELNSLLRDACGNVFDAVVIKDVSRLARNAVDFLSSIRKLKSLNISCKFITSNLCTEDGELILGILALVAQEESANLSKRVKFGKQLNAQKGRVPNAILGYDRIDGYHLSVNECEADIIRLIFDLYTKERCGVRKICSVLTARGLTTRFGSVWYAKTVRRILTNSIYCGIYVNNKWEVKDIIDKKMIQRPDTEHFKHHRPEWAIISKETFDEAQRLISLHTPQKPAEKTDRQSAANSSRYSNKQVFSNLMKCGVCGTSFIRKQYQNKSSIRTYWKCRTHDQCSASACDNAASVDEGELLEMIGAVISDRIDVKELICLVKQKFIAIYRKTDFSAEARKHKNEIRRLERHLKKYQEMFVAGLISIDELKQKADEYIKRMDCLKEQTNQRHSGNLLENLDSIIERTASEVLGMKNVTNNEIRALIESVDVEKNGEVFVHFHDREWSAV